MNSVKSMVCRTPRFSAVSQSGLWCAAKSTRRERQNEEHAAESVGDPQFLFVKHDGMAVVGIQGVHENNLVGRSVGGHLSIAGLFGAPFCGWGLSF